MYHSVAPGSHPRFSKYTVDVKSFEAQMRWLSGRRFTTITPDDLSTAAERARISSRAVLITFDDGFQSCFDYALPILDAYGFTATFYVVAGLIGSSSRWLFAERGCEFPLAAWSDLRRAQARGFHVGSHTLTHPRLPVIAEEACRFELQESRRLLEDGLGRAVRHLAYPFGSYNPQVRRMAEEAGYATACSVRIGLSGEDDDPLALHRVPVCGQDSLMDFICRLQTAYSPVELARTSVQEAKASFLDVVQV